MAEETEGGQSSVKGIIITAVSTVVLGVAGYVTKLITGEKEEAPQATSAPAPVININQAAAAPAPAAKTIIVNKTAPAAQSAPAPKPKAKTAKEELEEAPKW